MILEPIKAEILSVRTITSVQPELAKVLELKPEQSCIGMITSTIDDSLYAALDQGTKEAEVEVVYARSFYAGSDYASGPFSGEIIGILAAQDPDILASGIRATSDYLEESAWFYSADETNSLTFFPHVLSSTGHYLSKIAGISPGEPLAYLIAPPIEAILGIDAALKVAQVNMAEYYPPPSETNFAGALLKGDLCACQAAAKAFQETVLELAAHPHRFEPGHDAEERIRQIDARLKTSTSRIKEKEKPDFSQYILFYSGMSVTEKPEDFTHLFDNHSLVRKSEPVIKLRGKLDLLQAYIIDAQIAAQEEDQPEIIQDLKEVLDYARKLMGAEIKGTMPPQLEVGGLSADEMREISHNTQKYLQVGYLMPHHSLGKTAAKLNLLRAYSREVELTALEVFDQGAPHLSGRQKEAILHGLNRLSSVIYVLACKKVANSNQ